MILLHVKQNQTKLSKRTVPRIIREFDPVTFLMKDKLLSAPCKCCSGSQQRSSQDLRLRLTSLLIFIERECWISHSLYFFCSWDTTKHISHPCGRSSCRPARCLSSSAHSQISKRCLATVLWVSSSTTTGHNVLSKDVDPKRLDSSNNAMNGTQQVHT